GWDAMRTARHEEMNSLGLFQTNWDISPRDLQVIPWEAVQKPDWEASKMAVYAAMVDRMDQSIGRLVEALKRLGQFDDTLILFLSDNGGCAEFMAEDGWAQFYPDRLPDGRQIAMGNRPGLRPGDAQTFQSYDRPWANVSNAPFRLFKHYVHEGGISTPMIAHWPNGISPASPRDTPCHVVDIVPTLLSAAGLPPLSERGEHAAQTPHGEDLMPLLQGRGWVREQPIFFEHEGNAALRLGPFKLVRLHGQDWELYDITADRTELHDLAAGDTARVASLSGMYDRWADTSGIKPWAQLQPELLRAWNLRDADG
ncbi:MAG: sulfatase-like hydrolase/transferase, partial [Rhodobacteraceae bacterium]|nr:sulfatase-like hydrolase/transferase [Paracoccaceae bacterium]